MGHGQERPSHRPGGRLQDAHHPWCQPRPCQPRRRSDAMAAHHCTVATGECAPASASRHRTWRGRWTRYAATASHSRPTLSSQTVTATSTASCTGSSSVSAASRNWSSRAGGRHHHARRAIAGRRGRRVVVPPGATRRYARRSRGARRLRHDAAGPAGPPRCWRLGRHRRCGPPWPCTELFVAHLTKSSATSSRCAITNLAHQNLSPRTPNGTCPISFRSFPSLVVLSRWI